MMDGLRRHFLEFAGLVAIVVAFGFAPTVGAVDLYEGCTDVGGDGVCSDADHGTGDSAVYAAGGAIGRIVTTLIYITAAVAVIVIVIGGFRYVVSAGNPEQAKTARTIIIYALVGLVVSMIALVITQFVLNRVG